MSYHCNIHTQTTQPHQRVIIGFKLLGHVGFLCGHSHLTMYSITGSVVLSVYQPGNSANLWHHNNDENYNTSGNTRHCTDHFLWSQQLRLELAWWLHKEHQSEHVEVSLLNILNAHWCYILVHMCVTDISDTNYLTNCMQCLRLIKVDRWD